MAKLVISNITNLSQDGPVEFQNGVNVGTGATVGGDLNVVGVVTATSISGDGSALTNLPVSSISDIVAFKFLFSFDEVNSPRT